MAGTRDSSSHWAGEGGYIETGWSTFGEGLFNPWKTALGHLTKDDSYRITITRETQIQTNSLSKITKIKRQERSRVDEDIERLELSSTTGGSVHWYNYFPKSFVVPSKAGHKLVLCLAILLGISQKKGIPCPKTLVRIFIATLFLVAIH